MAGARAGVIKSGNIVEAEPVAEDRLRRIGLSLCAADLTKHRRAVTISFDTAQDRDAAWLDLHKLREETQRWARDA